jgi:hypothetical protein
MVRRRSFFALAPGTLGLAVCVVLASFPAAPAATPAQVSASAPRLTFTKVLKGSYPEYMAFTVEASGKATYDGRKLTEPASPRPLQISAGTTQRIFSLAESLGYFRSLRLESNRKVANMGDKTLTYESNGQVNRVQYNYTENRTAQELTDLFEKISGVEEHITQLEYAIKYDHLSVANQLRTIQIELDQNGLLETELLVPTLEKIANNPRLLHLAQVRAQDILKRIRGAD